MFLRCGNFSSIARFPLLKIYLILEKKVNKGGKTRNRETESLIYGGIWGTTRVRQAAGDKLVAGVPSPLPLCGDMPTS